MKTNIHYPEFKRTKLPAKPGKTLPNGYKFPENLMLMVYKISWSFYNTTGINIEELIGEAKLTAMEACLRYEKGKAEHLSTWVYKRVTNHLINFTKHEKRYCIPDPSFYDFNNIQTTPNAFFEMKDAMPTDCKFIVELVLYNRHKLAGLVPKAGRGEIVKMLRQEGWSWPRIWDSIRKMKATLNEMPENCIIY